MLIFTSYLAYRNSDISIRKEDHVVYNLNSYNTEYETLNLSFIDNNLWIPDNNGFIDYYHIYYKYIIDNDYMFLDLMKIVYSLYENKDVYLLVTDESNEFNTMITDLLKDIILERYGYRSAIAHTAEDIYNIQRNNDIFYFSTYGLDNLALDKNRYAYLISKGYILNGYTDF